MNLSAPEPSTSLFGGLRKHKRDNGQSTTPLMDGLSTISGAMKIAALNHNKGKDASSAELATFSSPTATGSGRGKRSSLRGKVKGALRRMDGSLFGSSSNLVFRGENDELSTMSNIHSTHSGSTSFPSPHTSAIPTPGAVNGSNSNISSTLPRTPSSSSTKQTSKSNLSTKFNASMRTFLSSMTPHRTPSLSPRRPSSKVSSHRRNQILTSMDASSNIVPTVPFDNDDDDENDNNGVRSDADSDQQEAEKVINDAGTKSSSTTTTHSRSLSPARQKRQERRDRKKAAKSMSSSSSTKVHSSNPRLRRRKYRRINTAQEASSPKDKSKDEKNHSNKDKASKKKPLARSAPRSSSQKLIRVQQEEEEVALIPGQTFLMSVLDDVQARMEASGELILQQQQQQQQQQESDEPRLLGEGEEGAASSTKKTTKKKAKNSILRKKRLGKKGRGSSSKEAEMALLAPESEREEDARQDVGALEVDFRQSFASEESSREELLVFDDSNGSSEEDEKDATSTEDAPPSLEAMMEPEDGDTRDGADETDDSDIPLMRRTRSELKEEVEKSLKHFAPLLNPTQPVVEPCMNPLGESARKDFFLTTNDFNFNSSDVASGNSPNSTMDDSVVLDIRAMEKRRAREEKQLKQSTGIVRGKSCSDLKAVSDESVARSSPWDHFLNVGDSWADLLDEVQTDTQKHLDSGSQKSTKQLLPQPMSQLLKDTRPGQSSQADRSVGSGSQRGRSRNSRKKSIFANETAAGTSKCHKGSGSRRHGAGERKKVHRRHTIQDDSENCMRAKERDKGKSTSNSQHSAHHRVASQQPEGRERSKSHSRRGHKSGSAKGRESSRSMRSRMNVSERRQHERKRDCSASKENQQSRDCDQAQTRDGGRKNSNSNANNSRRASSLRDLRRELFEGSKSKSDSRIDTRYRSRSRSKSRSLRDLGSSAQAMEQRPARRCSESWIDYQRIETTRDRSKSNSRRLAKVSFRAGDHRTGRSEQGHSHRREPVDPNTLQGSKDVGNGQGAECDGRETARKAEVARVAPGKSSSAILYGSEGNLKYHDRVQTRSKSGTFDRKGGKRDASRRGTTGGPVRSRRNSARGNHSDSAVGDSCTRSSIPKVGKRQRSRSLERARRSKHIVDSAKDEVEKLKRVSVSNELGSPSGRDLHRMARDSRTQSFTRSGGNKQLQTQRRNKEEWKSAKETKDKSKTSQDEKQKGRKPRHSGRARNSSNESRKLSSRRKSLEPSGKDEACNRNRDHVSSSRHSGRETSRTTSTGETTEPKQKTKSVGHKERRSRVSASRKDHESAVTIQKTSGSQSERPTRTLDATVAVSCISSSERYDRRVSL